MLAKRWQEDVELFADLGIGSTRTDVGLDVWDTAVWSGNPSSGAAWSGLEPMWRTVPCNLINRCNIRGGREHVWDSFDAGTLNLGFADEENRYAWYPDTPDENLELRPGTPVRVQALYAGTRYPLYRGFVEVIEELISGTEVIQVQLSGQDALAQLARVNLLERVPSGDNDTTTQRVSRLLDGAAWPIEWRRLDECPVKHQPTSMAQPTLEELLAVVWTEGGAIYADKNGNVRLRSRTWLFESTTTRKVVGNVDGVCPAEIKWSRAADDVINVVSLARIGGSAYTTQDEGSIARMGRRDWHRYDLTATEDGPVIYRADELLAERAEGRMRIDGIVIHAETANDWPFVLSVDYGWRLDVHYRHPIYGWEIELPVYVQAIEHDIRDDDWILTLGVDDVKPYEQEDARWSVALWDDNLALWI